MQQEPSIPVIPPDATDGSYVGEGKKAPGKWRGVVSTIAILIAAPVLALILTAFIFQSYEVDGPSMETTLQNRDRLIVWKTPRTVARLTNHAYVPHRGDIIVFIKRGLYEAGGSQEKQLIKRVIGLPGDRVTVQEGHITIYNKEHPEGFNPDINHDFSPNIASLTTGNIDMTVPADQVFVCGDNRTNSLDSRSFGTISADDIVGKLAIRIFPLNSFKSYI
ncbi:MAG TPA: signal peptidase I [Candidatus Limnocylindrales bacterium]|nr:signal peptidase I [Candidatus Limnocylindrales bacterium]